MRIWWLSALLVVGCAEIKVAGESGSSTDAVEDAAPGAQDAADGGVAEDTGETGDVEPDTALATGCDQWAGKHWQATTRTVNDACFDGKLAGGTFIRSGLDYFAWVGPLGTPKSFPGPTQLHFHSSRPTATADCVDGKVVITGTAEDASINEGEWPGCEVDMAFTMRLEFSGGMVSWTIDLDMTGWDEECGDVDDCQVKLTGDGQYVGETGPGVP